MPRPDDRFANVAAQVVVMSAANTLTFVEVLTGVSLGLRVGIIIDQVSYFLTEASLRELKADTDALQVAWTTSDDVTSLADVTDRRILDQLALTAIASGVPATGMIVKQPIIHQYFPPVIIAAPKIFLGMSSSGAAAASSCRSRLYFRFIELTSQEYLELAETFVLTG